MVVQHNLTAMNANRYLGINNSKLSKSLEKLSSGYAINRAGDNAAGLAVSEKMRSQIAGMTQGVKNAQDGISMVQTFEGALTETHSILQRMKTLADQMGNDSYDDPVDRKAAQQEFLQLNDELNQIADTDFNGVVVLNGGKMADGLEQVDGKFDYANKAAQAAEKQAAALADAQTAAQAKIDAAQKTFNAAKAAYDNTQNRDLCLNGEAVQWNTVDDSQYDKDAADALFNAVVKTGGDTGDTSVKDAAGNDISKDSLTAMNIEEMDVTFTYDEATGWSVTKGTFLDKDGVETEVDLTSLKGVLDNVTKTDNGGFIVNNGAASTPGSSDKAMYGNAIFTSKEAKTGDVVTLKYTHTSSPSYAPTNIGFDEESLHIGVKNGETPKIELDAGITNANMNEETAAALEKLNNASVEFAYAGEKITATISDDSLQIAEGANAGEYEISYTNSEGVNVKLAKVTTMKGSGATASTLGNKATTTAPTDANDWTNDLTATLTYKGGKWTDADGNEVTMTAVAATDGAGKTENLNVAVNGTPKEGDKINISVSKTHDATAANAHPVTITYVGQAKDDGTVGSIKFGVALDEGKYDASSMGPTIDPSKSADGVDSRAVDKAYNDAKAALEEAKAAYPKSAEDLPEEYQVSKSDAFDNSEAIMTYKDNIILQVGARTKDAVNFTFKYDSEAIGDLAADLNCTAAGLGTDKLTIATQKDANYAVDKIDQAINKVSLIRGTFGAIQNRLEHKIDNMNVSIENLTSAESAIRDTNMPQEMMNFTKQQILAQASQSMLAQANQLPQGVLSLLQ